MNRPDYAKYRTQYVVVEGSNKTVSNEVTQGVKKFIGAGAVIEPTPPRPTFTMAGKWEPMALFMLQGAGRMNVAERFTQEHLARYLHVISSNGWLYDAAMYRPGELSPQSASGLPAIGLRGELVKPDLRIVLAANIPENPAIYANRYDENFNNRLIGLASLVGATLVEIGDNRPHNDVVDEVIEHVHLSMGVPITTEQKAQR